MKRKSISKGSIIRYCGNPYSRIPGKPGCWLLAEKEVDSGKIILCDWKHRKEYVTWFTAGGYLGTVEGRYFSYDHLSSMDQKEAYEKAFLNFIHRK